MEKLLFGAFSFAGLRAAALVSFLLAGGATSEASLLYNRGETPGVVPGYTHLVGFDSLGAEDAATGRRAVLDVPYIALGVQAINGPLAEGAGAAGWSLGSNGRWTASRSFVGVDAGADTAANIYAALVVDFGALAVSQVGAVINFNPDFTYGAGFALPLYLAAYDVRGQLLQSYEVDVATRGGVNQGFFLGITDSSPSINRFEVSGPYAVIDNLSFTTPVPDAPGWVLAWAGAMVLALVRRRVFGGVQAPQAVPLAAER